MVGDLRVPPASGSSGKEQCVEPKEFPQGVHRYVTQEIKLAKAQLLRARTEAASVVRAADTALAAVDDTGEQILLAELKKNGKLELTTASGTIRITKKEELPANGSGYFNQLVGKYKENFPDLNNQYNQRLSLSGGALGDAERRNDEAKRARAELLKTQTCGQQLIAKAAKKESRAEWAASTGKPESTPRPMPGDKVASISK